MIPPRLPPPLPPPILPAPPSVGALEAKPRLSPARRWARILVWSTLGVVLTVRFLFPPEPVVRGREGGRGNRGEAGPRRGWGWRGPTRVQEPTSAVPSDLWRISIEIAPKDMDKLRNYYWGGPGSTVQRPEVTATIREGGIVYSNVTVHSKGSAGSFRPVDDKPALTINFSKHGAGQKFHGLSKISLNNSVQDPAYISEQLSRELFLAAGVPVPEATHATLILNGRDLGLYVVAEGWGKPFLRRHFENVEGNLYDSGFVRDIDAPLEINSGSDGESRQELQQLWAAATEGNPKQRWERLKTLLDVDRFASMLALEVMICHWDGYSLNRNNYRVFHDRAAGRMVFMPHGLDQLFGGGGRMDSRSSLQPSMRGQVAHAFMATPEGRQLYFARLAQLQTNVFREEKLIARVHEISQRIRPTLAAYSPDLAAEHDALVLDMCQRISDRVHSITEQLGRPRVALNIKPGGVVPVVTWVPNVNQQARGSPPSFEQSEVDGKKALVIKASPGGGAGSWRARVHLEQGEYRFEGRVRTERITGNGGVALRISGSARQYANFPGGEWIPLTFAFSVEEAQADIQLVCDFEASSGQAAFELGSLRLVRE